MPQLTFEIIRQGETPFVADVLSMPDYKTAWCHVEILALRIKDGAGAHIRVRNSEGEIIIRTGVATALVSIEKCCYLSCPLKAGLGSRAIRFSPPRVRD